MNKMRIRRRYVLAVVAALLALAAAGTANALVGNGSLWLVARKNVKPIPDTNGVFWGCVPSSGGALTLLASSSTKCKRGQIKVHFNRQGKPGPAGKAGPRGATGATGPAGPRGSTGAPGRTSSGTQITWRKTVAKAGPGTGGASPAPTTSNLSGSVQLASVGTIRILGICWTDGTDTFAATFVKTTANGAYAQGFGAPGGEPLDVSDGAVQVSNGFATDDSIFGPQWLGPDDGSWAVTNAAGTIVLNGFANQGVGLQGSSGPACSFSGFVVEVAGP